MLSQEPNVESEFQPEIMMNNEQGELKWKEINWRSDWKTPWPAWENFDPPALISPTKNNKSIKNTDSQMSIL